MNGKKLIIVKCNSPYFYWGKVIWCERNCKGKWKNYHPDNDKITERWFEFENTDDALFFKMRWL
jgi:hypothetical protein